MQTDAAIPWEGERESVDDEATLVEAAQQDPAAFAALYRRYRHRVYAYLCARLTNAEDAADLTQQVFLQALAALPRYRPSAVPFGVWLFRIARNAATDHRRRQQRSAVTWEAVPDAALPRAEHLDARRSSVASPARPLQLPNHGPLRCAAAHLQLERSFHGKGGARSIASGNIERSVRRQRRDDCSCCLQHHSSGVRKCVTGR